jgi:uncharacterized protein
MTDPRPVTVITGASSGIGAALAREFAKDGHELALVALPGPRLDAIANEIAATGVPRPGVFPIDLGASDGVDRLAQALIERGLEPANMVNCAGFGLIGDAADLDRAEQIAMVLVNVRALTDLSLRWIESLARNRGGILNVSSITAFFPGPGMAVYHSTKAYVLSFGEALHFELKSKGVRVTTLCPGPVETPFMTRAGIPRSYYPLILERPAAYVARHGYHGFKLGKCIVVPGSGNRVVAVLQRCLPRDFMTRVVARRYKQFRQRQASSP